ncbi:MAG: acyltransferase, partial [Myxococcales bacterium]|nr:acyltransferase [Myxococcales bacterium]
RTLDGLRAIAVLLVLWFHLPMAILPGVLNKARSLFDPGYFGVDFFFVLSGFLITRILLVNREKGVPLRVFWVRRFVRIFPIYYLLLAVLAALGTGALIWPAALYVSNHVYTGYPLTHTWSLAVEEQFYLFWPLLVGLAPRAIAGRLVAFVAIPAALLTAIGLALVYPPAEAGEIMVRVTATRMLSLALGGLCAVHESWLRVRPRRLWSLAAALLFVAVPALLSKGHLPPAAWPVARLVGATFASTAVFMMVLALPETSLPGRLMSAGALPRIGLISYGIYLYHMPIFHVFGLSPGDSPTAINAVLAVLTTFAVSELSFRIVEKPLNGLKDGWSRQLARPA